jgi:hypothetical protein
VEVGVLEDSNHCWVVRCKNHWFHLRRSLFSSHRIPLGETDAVAALRPIKERFRVRCDECSKEYLYKLSDVRRYEQELPGSFTPHPLFRGDGERRRSERWSSEVTLFVRGESTEKGVFEEEVLATSLSAQGALIGLWANVEVGQTLILKNPRNQAELVGHVVRLEPLQQGGSLAGIEFVRPAPDFWRLELRTERRSSRKQRKAWPSVGVECRALTARLIVWLRSGSS